MLATFMFAPVALAAALPADPLGSPMWADHARVLFADAPVEFDRRVVVDMPMLAENQRVFPVAIDASALPDVKRIVLLADLNPIPVAIDYAPTGAAPVVSVRIKLDQRTPVRAAVLTGDGRWHVNGAWIDAAGGGCSAPPVSRVRGDWAEHLGEVRARAVPVGDEARLRVAIRHPMDTGLVGNTPLYHVEELTVSRGETRLASMKLWAAVAEDPAFGLIVPAAAGDTLTIRGRDTNGREIEGRVAVQAAP